MDFKEFLPKEEEIEEIKVKQKQVDEKINQNQFYDIITSSKPDWQAIVYELVHTEQLDPWDIDLVILTKRYFEKILELEENPDFYVSSKVLLAAALLLRIKSEYLLNRHIKSIDEILFGKKEESKYIAEKIEIDEDELPLLIPKTPLPRSRRVTLQELMIALNKAIDTESRRIRREVAVKRARKLAEVDIPTFKKIDLKDRIKQFYARVLTAIKKRATSPEKHLNKVGYSDLIGKEKEERLACFLPLLHLNNSQKLWIEQEEHLDEIWIYLYDFFSKNKTEFIEDLKDELESDVESMDDREFLKLLFKGIRVKRMEEAISGKETKKPSDALNNKENISEDEEIINEAKLERTNNFRQKLEEKRKLKDEIAKELAEELIEIDKETSIIKKQEKIDKISGFSDDM